MAVKYLVLVVLMFGTVWAQTDQQISDTLDNLPADLKGKVNESEIAIVKNKTEAAFKEKCDKNGGPDAFEKAQKAYEVFPQCVKDAIGLDDPAVLKNEIENAKPNGTVDEVFKKYCAKSPEAKKCFKDMSETVEPCFNAEERKNLKIVHNLTEQLAEFICYKDGDRIALFIAEGGPDCFETKQEEIQQCVKDNLGVDYDFDANNISANSIPQIAFGEKECAKFHQLQKCFVGALEKCQAPTSANIVESLFKFAFKATPCKPEKEVKGMEARTNTSNNETKPNAASGLAVTSTTFLFALASTRLF